MVYISSWTVRPLFLLAIHISTSFASTCYNPDGSIAADTPCTNSTMSACCAADAYCLDNGLCITAMILSRGSCTDQTWKASECASYCQNGTLLLLLPVIEISSMISPARPIANTLLVQDNPSGGKGMAPCSSTLWSCNYGTCAQDNFTVPNGNIVLREYQASSLGVSVAALTVTVAPTMVGSSLLSASTATATDSGQSDTSQTAALGSATTSTVNVGGQNGSTTCTSASADKTSSSTIIAVGVGIGAPLGIALAALLLMFCRERKRNAHLQQSQDSLVEVENHNRNNMSSTMRCEMDGPGQERRMTVPELGGDMMGNELPEGNLRKLGGYSAI